MIRLPDNDLPPRAAGWLNNWQSQIDVICSYSERVAEAKRLFPLKNRKGNKTFDSVKNTLREMQGDLVRCVYCEDSSADEIEHFFPKNVFPDQVFQWENYSYACGPCNGPKNDQFEIFRNSDEKRIDVTPPHWKSRPKKWKPKEPPLGLPVLINPRHEDPLDFLWLDLIDTFRIDPIASLSAHELERAEYTRDVLALNRDLLLRARETAFEALGSMLAIYADEFEGKCRRERLKSIERAISRSPHQTVWREMFRQRASIADLNQLFQRFPVK